MTRSTRRIVVAIDPDTPSDLPLEFVQQLLQDAATEILGLFVEDTRLLAHAQTRRAREIVFGGGERVLDAEALARQLRARAAAAQQAFEVRARNLGLRHGFAIRRGDIAGELLSAAADAEALVVGVAAKAGAPRAWSAAVLARLANATLPALLFAREGWRTGRGIVAATDLTEAGTAALNAAVRLAARSRSPLTLLVAAAEHHAREALAQHALALARQRHVELVCRLPTTSTTPESLLRIASGARLVVLPRDELGRNSTALARLVVDLGTSLLVVMENRSGT
jgi:hypothetical protein